MSAFIRLISWSKGARTFAVVLGAMCLVLDLSLSSAAIAAPSPLTVQAEDVPGQHSGDAFTFTLRFSEAFAVSARTMRVHAMTASNARIHSAKRVDNPHNDSILLELNLEWRITVEPDGEGDVTVTLPATTDCEASGALCTGDGRMLSNTVTVSVPHTATGSQPPLTARFEGVPGQHSGDAFTFTLRFSEAFAVSARTMRVHAMTASNARIHRAKRVDNPHNDGILLEPNLEWRITVEPDGEGDVTVTLPATTDCGASGALCTGDGRMLSSSVTKTVRGPAARPRLSGASVTELGADAGVRSGA